MDLRKASDKEPHLWPYFVVEHLRLKDHKLHDAKIPFLVPRPKFDLVTRKPAFGVYDQVRLKPACSATETFQSLEIFDLASI